MELSEIKAYGAGSRLMEILSSLGHGSLYPPQEEAVRAGVLKMETSFVISAPTAAGKTLIAEMAALNAITGQGGRTKCIYLVPLRALAREKFDDFSKKYGPFGVRITQSTGDFDSADPWLASADIIITTNEKLDSLIRHRAPWLKDVRLVISDEIHLLGDSHRGPTLEIVLTRLRSLNPRLKVIALSATIPNALELARWLEATLIESPWRPVPLKEGVFFNGAAIFDDGTVKWIREEALSDVVDLAMDTIREKGQALIFVGTRRSAEAVAAKARKFVSRLASEEENEALQALSTDVLETSSEPTRTGKKLAESVADGVAFHHAGIIYQQRKLVEDAFRGNTIKLMVSTTTLAMGLNLPSRRVIIRDWWRYLPGAGMQSIPAIEIKQMSGRAGRPGYDTYGESVIVARSKRDEKYIFEKYIKGAVEDIKSQLASESALRTHILAAIAGTFASSRHELIEFLSQTFFAYQMGTDHLASITDAVLDFLQSEKMIEAGVRDLSLKATVFGRRVSELYLDPLSGVVMRDALTGTGGERSAFPLLHMLARTPDMMRLSLKKKDFDEMFEVFHAHAEALLIPEEDRYASEEMLSELKTASALMQWIMEMPEDGLTSHFGIGPGDLRTLVELADWLLYSASQIADIFKAKEAKKPLSILRTRIKYGVKDELVPLVSLKGIGRVRGRSLYEAGFRSLKDLREADIAKLEAVPHIGHTIAEDIKKQVSRGDE